MTVSSSSPAPQTTPAARRCVPGGQCAAARPPILETAPETTRSFHRRPLPAPAVPFSSREGLAKFADALNEGTLGTYFALAEQFHTQAEPSFCGLASLVMVLNALAVDPRRQWKGVWRWYDEAQLDCCESLDVVKQRGVNLDKVACTARCNFLDCDLVRGPTTHDENNGTSSQTNFAAQFRDVVTRVSRQPPDAPTELVIVSYSRKPLNQTGDGHFSPIAGYHAASDSVLVLDTARFKYAPHWVSVAALADAMARVDPETGKPRGFLALRRRPDHQTDAPLFRLAFADHAAFLGRRAPVVALHDALAAFRDTMNTSSSSLLEDDAASVVAFALRRLDHLVARQAMPKASLFELACCAAVDCEKVAADLGSAADALGLAAAPRTGDHVTSPPARSTLGDCGLGLGLADAVERVATLAAVPPDFWPALLPDLGPSPIATLVDLLERHLPPHLEADFADLRERFATYLRYELASDAEDDEPAPHL